jgi:hypothetical protein
MPNPRDWFRPRRSETAAEDGGDPFAKEGVLDLGRAMMRGDSVPSSVPPPPRPAEKGRLLHSSAFTVRPELGRDRPRPAAAPPVAAAPVAVGAIARATPPAAERSETRTDTAERSDAWPNAGERRGAAAFRPAERRPPAAPAPEPRPPVAQEPSPGMTAGEVTAFTLSAPGPIWMRGKPRETDAAQLHSRLRDAFTPTRPKHDASMFSGRFREMERIIAAIEEERAHVVVFGERGSGKTSLCNILSGKATEAGYVILHYACSSGIGFEEIFRNFLRRIPGSFLAEGLGAGSRRVETFAQLLPEGPFGVTELVEALARIHDRHVILVVDEYDRVVSEDVKSKLAELLKIMSDAAVPVTMLLIGVADDVSELFGKHPSLQRTLVTVPMPLMPRRDIEGLIAAGESHAGLTFVPEVREAIIDFAQGLPYQAQLLCLFAARNAVRRNSRQVERDDLRYAVERCAEGAEARIKDAYGQAVGTPVESAFEDALFQAAHARSDEFGSFTAADVAAAGPPGAGDGALLALQEPLKQLTEPERGSVLRRSNTATGPRYQFCSQMFRNYVLANQASRRGLI